MQAVQVKLKTLHLEWFASHHRQCEDCYCKLYPLTCPTHKTTWVQVWQTWRPQPLAYYSFNKNALLQKQSTVWTAALSCWKRHSFCSNWTSDQDIVWWTHLVTQIFMCQISRLLLTTSLSQGWQNLQEQSAVLVTLHKCCGGHLKVGTSYNSMGLTAINTADFENMLRHWNTL